MPNDFFRLLQGKFRHYAVLPRLRDAIHTSAFKNGLFLLGILAFVQACRLLLHDVTSKKQRQAMKLAVDYMEKGMAVSEALGQTGLFPSLVCRIVSAGERAGNLEQMLYLLGQYYEQADKQRRFMMDALSYPLFLMVCTTAMAVGIVAFILPVFEAMFEQMQMPLPAMTAYMLAGAHILQSYGAALAAGTVTGIASLFLLLRRPGVRRYTEDKLFSISVLRRLCVIFCWQRFSQMLAVQIRCGIPLLDALDDGAAVVPVDWFRRAVNQAARRLARPDPLCATQFRRIPASDVPPWTQLLP